MKSLLIILCIGIISPMFAQTAKSLSDTKPNPIIIARPHLGLSYVYPIGCCNRGFLCFDRGRTAVTSLDENQGEGQVKVSDIGNQVEIKVHLAKGKLTKSLIDDFINRKIQPNDTEINFDFAAELLPRYKGKHNNKAFKFLAKNQTYKISNTRVGKTLEIVCQGSYLSEDDITKTVMLIVTMDLPSSIK
jgi:hypothetical protein